MNNPHKILLPTERTLKLVEVKEILYCEADGGYTKVHLADGMEFISTRLLKEIEKKLKPHAFFRVNKSQLVNMDSVKEIHKNHSVSVTLKNEKVFGVSDRQVPQFNRFIRERY